MDRLTPLRYAVIRNDDMAQGVTITNILGGFNRGLFVNLIALLLVVTAGYILCLLAIQIAVSGGIVGGPTQTTLPGQQPNEVIQIETELAAAPIDTVATAAALSIGLGMLLAAVGLFRRARWGWLGTLLVCAALIVLILLQVLSGMGVTGSSLIQLLVFSTIFLLFLLDNGIKALLWSNEISTE